MEPVTVKTWKFVGGQLALDFVNTVGGRTGGAILRDKFSSYGDLVSWSQAAKIVNAAEARTVERLARQNPRAAAAILRRAIALREAIYSIFESRGDLGILNRELEIARRHEKIARARTGFVWHWDDAESLERTLWPVARAAATLLSSADRKRVRGCAGKDCGWLFIDTSRNRGRRWCDMRDCGNRAKAARFRERLRQSAR